MKSTLSLGPRAALTSLWRHFVSDSLFRNSVYLMASTAIMGLLGFVFWAICSRLYDAQAVGLATSLVAAAMLMNIFSMLGFGNVIIRFLAGSKRPERLISTAFILTGITSVLTAIGFLLWGMYSDSPTVHTDQPEVLVGMFIGFVLILTADSVLDSIFIAYRAAKFVLIKNTVMSLLKVGLPFALLSQGFVGIVSSIALAVALSFIGGLVWLIFKFGYRPSRHIDRDIIRETRRFAASNYLGNVLGATPATIMPLIITSRLDAAQAAFFYMPLMVATLLHVIPSATGQSLLAEASHDESRLTVHLKNAVRHLLLMLTPAVLLTIVLAHPVLSIFGEEYAREGTLPLQILAVASLIGAANYLGDALLNIKKLAGAYVAMNAIGAITITSLAFITAPHGLVAVAWSSLIGQTLTFIAYIILNWRLIVGQLLSRSA
jgi:O-antigen/teichoic acid export membrane protein